MQVLLTAILRDRRLFVFPAFNNPIDDSVFHGLVFIHEIVTLSIRSDRIHVTACMRSQYRVQPFAQTQYLTGVNINVGSLALKSTPGLMNHDSRMR